MQALETKESFDALVDQFEPLSDIVEKSVNQWSVGEAPAPGVPIAGCAFDSMVLNRGCFVALVLACCCTTCNTRNEATMALLHLF